MDNSTTTWIIVALLVLLIGAAIFMLLRRPGGDDSLDGRDAPAVDRDRDGHGDLGGRTAPEQAQAVSPQEEHPRGGDAPFDQSSYDAGGATAVERPVVEDHGAAAGQGQLTDEPVARDPDHDHDHDRDHDRMLGADDPVVGGPVAGATTQDRRTADDFFGVDADARDEVSTDPAFQDPRTDGHRLAEDAGHADHEHHGHGDQHDYQHGDHQHDAQDEAGHHEATHDQVRTTGPGDEDSLGAPASEGFYAAPASRGYDAESAREAHPSEQTSEDHLAAPAREDAYREPTTDTHDHQRDDEPLTADEVLESRGMGAGGAAVVDETVTDHGHTEHGYADHGYADHHGAGATAAGAGAAAVSEPVVEPRPGAEEGGAVYAESVFGPGSVEPGVDGSGPEGWQVKGNTGSMLFHTVDSPSYDAVHAEVWFESEEAARNAGFAHWDRRRR